MKFKLKLSILILSSAFSITAHSSSTTDTISLGKWGDNDNATDLSIKQNASTGNSNGIPGIAGATGVGTSGIGQLGSFDGGSLTGVVGSVTGSGVVGEGLGGLTGSTSGIGQLGSFNGGALTSVVGSATGTSGSALSGLGSLAGNITGLSNITSGNGTLADYIKAGSTVVTTYGALTGDQTATTIGGLGMVAGNTFGTQINNMGSSIGIGSTNTTGQTGQFSSVNYENSGNSTYGEQPYGYNVGDRVDTSAEQSQFSNGLYDNGSSSTYGDNGAVYNQDTGQWSTPYQGTTADSLSGPSTVYDQDTGQWAEPYKGTTADSLSGPSTVYDQDTGQWAEPYKGTTASSLEASTGETSGWKDGGTRYVPTAAEVASNERGDGTYMNPTSGKETTSQDGTSGPTYVNNAGQTVYTESGIVADPFTQ